MKITNIVAVIEQIDGIYSFKSYPDTPEGNEEAEEQFTACALENGAEEKDVESYLEDGIYKESETYEVVLVHSS